MEEASAWAQALGTKGPPLKVTQLSIQTAQICAEAQTLFDSSEHGKEWKSGLLEIIKDATALDNLYQNWIDKSSVSGTWRYHTLYLPPNDALAADGVVQVYHDLYTAYIWTSCCSKRAHLHEVSLRCLSLLGCHPGAKDLSSKLKSLGLAENLLARFRCIVEDMVSGICAAVPFMLGDVDLEGRLAREKQRMPLAGYLLLWPLHVARASSDTGGERELWIRGRLELIDSEMGIRFGRLMANKVKKEPWNLE